MLTGKVITVGVTGGIAAYKTCEVVSSLIKLGATVHVVMTKNATQFVSPLTFETLSSNRVIIDMFDRNFNREVEHISIAKKSDIFLIAPCTANVAGKLANGIADDFLTTTVMAAKCPIVLAPAMNTGMLTSESYVNNVKTLNKRGFQFIESESGRLACGDVGDGRMADPKKIVDCLCDIIVKSGDYSGKAVLVTAGATIEPIDPVRYITNHSSGKMGVELANAAQKRGAKVILIAGLINPLLEINHNIKVINVKTTNDMLEAVLSYLPNSEIIIKAAAPSDYTVSTFTKQKIKTENLVLQLEKNPDIAKRVGELKENKKLIIFSAETENLHQNAMKKLNSKNADMVIANDVTQEGAGFNVDTNIVTIITKNTKTQYPIMQKRDLSNIILDEILKI